MTLEALAGSAFAVPAATRRLAPPQSPAPTALPCGVPYFTRIVLRWLPGRGGTIGRVAGAGTRGGWAVSDRTHEGAMYPILEFDPTPEAIIEPSKIMKPRDVPEHAVACFFQDVITQLSQEHTVTVVKHLRSEIGRHPVYELDLQGRRLAVFHPGVGAPLAAGFLEEMIAIGSRKFIVCGGSGVLRSEIAVGHVLVPTVAVRDEGTSYHYLPPGREGAAGGEGGGGPRGTLGCPQ